MSPNASVSDASLLDHVTSVFRHHGYVGASLAILQEHTGLKRSSLYHRYPGGKDEMAQAVLGRVARHFTEEILATGAAHDHVPARVAAIGTALRAFYGDGRLSCLLDTMRVGNPPEPVALLVTQAMTAWISAFADLAAAGGLPPDHATRRATRAVAAIEGALVVARATGDPSVFDDTIDDLLELLIGRGARTMP